MRVVTVVVTVAVALAAGVGCGGGKTDPGAGLAALSNPWLHVQPLGVLEAQTGTVYGLVIEQGGCVALSTTVHATVNGEPMVMTSPGGTPQTGADGGCGLPTFEPPTWLGRPTGSVTYIVTDGTTTFTMAVTGVYADRSVLLAGPGGSTGRAGQQVALHWLPDSDRFDPTLSGGFDFRYVAVRSATPTWVLADPSAVTVEGAVVRFTIPQPAADAIRGTEDGALHIQGRARANIERCTGVSRCLAEVTTENAIQLPFLLQVP